MQLVVAVISTMWLPMSAAGPPSSETLTFLSIGGTHCTPVTEHRAPGIWLRKVACGPGADCGPSDDGGSAASTHRTLPSLQPQAKTFDQRRKDHQWLELLPPWLDRTPKLISREYVRRVSRRR